MSLWERVRRDLSISYKVNTYYTSQANRTGVPLEVRDVFAQFIDATLCRGGITFFTTKGPNPENPDDIKLVQKFHTDLIQEMQAWLAKNENSSYHANIQKTLLLASSTKDILGWYLTLRDLINFELSHFPNSQYIRFMAGTDLFEIGQLLRLMIVKSKEFRDDMTPANLTAFQSTTEQVILSISQSIPIFIGQLSSWKVQQKEILDSIVPQQQNGNSINISNLQLTAEQLYNCICTVFNEIKIVENRGAVSEISVQGLQYEGKLVSLLQELVRNSFHVTEQSKVLQNGQKDSTVNITVCHLSGNSLFRDYNLNTPVKMTRISGTQAEELQKMGCDFLNKFASEITSPTEVPVRKLKLDPKTKQVKANFKNIPIAMGSAEVDKFCFLFTSTLNVLGVPLQIWTMSFPITRLALANNDVAVPTPSNPVPINSENSNLLTEFHIHEDPMTLLHDMNDSHEPIYSDLENYEAFQYEIENYGSLEENLGLEFKDAADNDLLFDDSFFSQEVVADCLNNVSSIIF